MAQIQMTEQLAGALIQRLQAEYGTQAVSNFALDILLDAANAELAKLREINAGLMVRVKSNEEQLEELKRAADPKRAEVMGAADSVKKRQAVNGANTDSK
jgi:hypothetical protein